MAVEFSYSDVEAVLATLNRVAPDKRIAFRARLKHLQRLGFPKGANTGTGRRAVYTFKMLLQMSLATELAQTGMAPKRIVQTVENAWPDLEYSFYMTMLADDIGPDLEPPVTDNRFVWVLSPEALRELSIYGEEDLERLTVSEAVPLGELEEYFEQQTEDGDDVETDAWMGEFYRHVVIQLKPLMELVVMCARAVRPDIPVDQLGAEFDQQMEKELAAMDRRDEWEAKMADRIAANPDKWERLLKELGANRGSDS